jgi:hypothetical protein
MIKIGPKQTAMASINLAIRIRRTNTADQHRERSTAAASKKLQGLHHWSRLRYQMPLRGFQAISSALSMVLATSFCTLEPDLPSTIRIEANSWRFQRVSASRADTNRLPTRCSE